MPAVRPLAAALLPLLCAVALPLAAQGFPGGGRGGGHGMGGHRDGPPGGPRPAASADAARPDPLLRFGAALHALRETLQLRAEQVPAWEALRDAVQADLVARRAQRNAGDEDHADGLTRLRAMAARERERADAAEHVSHRVQALLDQLDDSQRAPFLAQLDEAFAPEAGGAPRQGAWGGAGP